MVFVVWRRVSAPCRPCAPQGTAAARPGARRRTERRRYAHGQPLHEAPRGHGPRRAPSPRLRAQNGAAARPPGSAEPPAHGWDRRAAPLLAAQCLRAGGTAARPRTGTALLNARGLVPPNGGFLCSGSHGRRGSAAGQCRSVCLCAPLSPLPDAPASLCHWRRALRHG